MEEKVTRQDWTNILSLLKEMMHKEYSSEFIIEDGLRQHKDGLDFRQWAIKSYGADICATLRFNV